MAEKHNRLEIRLNDVKFQCLYWLLWTIFTHWRTTSIPTLNMFQLLSQVVSFIFSIGNIKHPETITEKWFKNKHKITENTSYTSKSMKIKNYQIFPNFSRAVLEVIFKAIL